MKKAIFLILFLLVLTFAYSENIIEKIDLYKESIDTITQYYQWSFMLVFTMLLAFIGTNLYINNQKINKELESKRKELEELFSKERKQLLEENNKRILNLENKIEINIQRLKKENELEIYYIKFEKESLIGVKLSISLKILILLSELYGEHKNWDWKFQEYLIFIIKTLEEGTKFDMHETDDVNEMFAKLPIRFDNERKKIIEIEPYEHGK